MRCETTSGKYRCDKDAGHGGECETQDRPMVPPRELVLERLRFFAEQAVPYVPGDLARALRDAISRSRA